MRRLCRRARPAASRRADDGPADPEPARAGGEGHKRHPRPDARRDPRRRYDALHPLRALCAGLPRGPHALRTQCPHPVRGSRGGGADRASRLHHLRLLLLHLPLEPPARADDPLRQGQARRGRGAQAPTGRDEAPRRRAEGARGGRGRGQAADDGETQGRDGGQGSSARPPRPRRHRSLRRWPSPEVPRNDRPAHHLGSPYPHALHRLAHHADGERGAGARHALRPVDVRLARDLPSSS